MTQIFFVILEAQVEGPLPKWWSEPEQMRKYQYELCVWGENLTAPDGDQSPPAVVISPVELLAAAVRPTHTAPNIVQIYVIWLSTMFYMI